MAVSEQNEQFMGGTVKEFMAFFKVTLAHFYLTLDVVACLAWSILNSP
jgi:hypothetical protein